MYPPPLQSDEMPRHLPPPVIGQDVAVKESPIGSAKSYLKLWFQRSEELRSQLRWVIFALAIGWCLTVWASPALALALGMALSLSIGHPFHRLGHRTAKVLLQICVVLLGLTMNLHAVLQAGADGAVFAVISIAVTLVAGYFLGRWLKIDSHASMLISVGTAICGGSAIAAVGTVLDAPEEQMTVAMGTVFLLNAVALFLFVPIGHALNLSQHQFGVWAGISIHDISSVVAACNRYGPLALTTGTAVKLSRALWIVPVSLAVAWVAGRERRAADPNHTGPRGKIQIPWFIGLFLVACVVKNFVPGMQTVDPAISRISTVGLTLTLFLIGAGLSRRTLATVGFKPLLQGVLLWALIGGGTLLAVTQLR